MYTVKYIAVYMNIHTINIIYVYVSPTGHQGRRKKGQPATKEEDNGRPATKEGNKAGQAATRSKSENRGAYLSASD